MYINIDIHTPLPGFAVCLLMGFSSCENSKRISFQAFFAHCPHEMPWRRLCLRVEIDVSTMK